MSIITAQEQALRKLKHNSGNKPWKVIAKMLGISERALLSYIAAQESRGYRPMPEEVWAKLQNVLGLVIERETELYYPTRKVISVSSQKGGVGKTTIEGIIAFILALMGYKVLQIDMDAQANLTESYYAEDDFPVEVLPDPDSDVFQPGPAHVWNMFYDRDVVPIEINENLHLIGSSLDLVSIQMEDTDMITGNFARSIEKLKDAYDFIILDTLPSFGNILAAAHRASDWLIIPTELARFSRKGIKYQLSTAENTRNTYEDCNLELLGIVVNKVQITNRRKNELLRIQDGYLHVLTAIYDDAIFRPLIRNSPTIPESQALAVSLVDYAPKSESTLEFTELTQVIVNAIKNRELEEVNHG